MIIHIVQAGDTIDSISQKYQISTSKLLQDNGLEASVILVIGQTLVITYPLQSHTVQEGDTLGGIADAYHITVKQLLRNNPYLSDREYIYPGEIIAIRYHNAAIKISTNGYAYPFIDKGTLKKTLPFLTYLSIYNYQATSEGIIISGGDDFDDDEIVRMAWAYNVAPLMLLTTLTTQGKANIEVAYNILLNKEYQERNIDNILEILKSHNYYGLNLTFQYVSPTTVKLYEDFLARVSSRLNKEGYPVFVTINPRINYSMNDISFEKVDYSLLSQMAKELMFLTYNWGVALSPPVPNSVYMSKDFLNYVATQIPSEKINIGLSVIGYDWKLPYEPDTSKATALTFDRALALANDVNAVIQYDEEHQAAYFEYEDLSGFQHIVWFKDARSIDALVKLVLGYKFHGIGIWNIMQYFSQMWLVINTQYEIDTLPI